LQTKFVSITSRTVSTAFSQQDWVVLHALIFMHMEANVLTSDKEPSI
jgi:hypothetical protein